jgi:hypothetical protein
MANELAVLDTRAVLRSGRLAVLSALKNQLAVLDLHDDERIRVAAAIEEHARQHAVLLADLEPVDVRGIRPGAREIPRAEVRIRLARRCRRSQRTEEKESDRDLRRPGHSENPCW